MKIDCNPFKGTAQEGQLKLMHYAGNILKDPNAISAEKYQSLKYNGNEILPLLQQAMKEAHAQEWGNAGLYLGQIGQEVIKGTKSSAQMKDLDKLELFQSGWISGVW